MPSENDQKKLNSFLVVSTLILIVSIFCVRGIILKPGVVSLRSDWDLPHFDSQYQEFEEESGYQWWSRGLGAVHLNIIDYPIIYLLSNLNKLGLSTGDISTLVIVLSMFISGIAMYLVIRNFGISKWIAFTASMFYMTTPLLFNTIVNGWIVFLFSYSLFPLLFYFFVRGVFCEYERRGLILLFTGVLLGIVNLQISYWLMTTILLFGFTLHKIITRSTILNTKEVLLRVLLIFVVALAFQAHFVIPSVISAEDSLSHASSSLQYFKIVRAPNLLDSFSGLGSSTPILTFPFDEIVKQSGLFWKVAHIILLLLIFISLLLRNPRNETYFFFLLALGSIFLLKGLNQPLGFVNGLFYTHLSFIMALIRNTHYITVLIGFSYAILLSFTLEQLSERAKDLSGKYNLSSILDEKYMSILVLMLIVVNSFPFFTGNFYDNVHKTSLPSEYDSLNNFFQQDKSDYRVLWVPTLQPLSYNHSKYQGYDPLLRGAGKPGIGNYVSTPFEKLVTTIINVPLTGRIGDILHLLNVEYIVVRPDFESHYGAFVSKRLYPKSWSVNNSIKIISNQSDIYLPDNASYNNILLFKNRKQGGLFFVVSNLYTISGDPSSLISLSYGYDSYFKDKDSSAFAFIESNNLKVLNLSKGVIVIDGNFEDLLLLDIGNQYKIDLVSYTPWNSTIDNDWVGVTSYWWYHPRLAALNEGSILSLNRGNSIQITPPRYPLEDNRLLIKGFSLTQYGNLRVTINENRTYVVNLNDFSSWHELTPSVSEPINNINIVNEYGENVVEYLIVIPRDTLDNSMNKISRLSSDKTFVYINELENSHAYEDVLVSAQLSKQWSIRTYQYDTQSQKSLSNLKYDASFAENATIISVNFTGDAKVDEFLLFYYPYEYDLSRYPYFRISHKVENPSSQFIQIGIDLDFNEDGEIDKTYYTSPLEQRDNSTVLSILDLYSEVSKTFTEQTKYRVVALRILTHKNYKTSSDKKQKNFYIYHFAIYDSEPRTTKDYSLEFSQGKASYLKYPGVILTSEVPYRINKKYSAYLLAEGEGAVLINGNKITLRKSPRWYTITSGDLSSNMSLRASYLGNTKGGAYLDQYVVYMPGKDISKNAPLIAYKKINPTKYIINITNATDPYFIIFTESYNPGWRLLADEVSDINENHFVINGYANGWYIRQRGDYQIVIEFSPQRYYSFGFIVSIIILLLLFIVILFVLFTSHQPAYYKPKKSYEGRISPSDFFTESILDLYRKGRISKKEAREYLGKAYTKKEVESLLDNDI